MPRHPNFRQFILMGEIEFFKRLLPLTFPAVQAVAGMITFIPTKRWSIADVKTQLSKIEDVFSTKDTINKSRTAPKCVVAHQAKLKQE